MFMHVKKKWADMTNNIPVLRVVKPGTLERLESFDIASSRWDRAEVGATEP
jgi:hypothetical protein